MKRHMDNANSVCYNVINHYFVTSLSFELEPECYGEENAFTLLYAAVEKIHYDNRITSIL